MFGAFGGDGRSLEQNSVSANFTMLIFEDRTGSLSFDQYCFTRNELIEIVFGSGRYALNSSDRIALLFKTENSKENCLERVILSKDTVLASGSISWYCGEYDVTVLGTESECASIYEANCKKALPNAKSVTYNPCYFGHTEAADDGDCTTPVTCTACSTVVTEAKSHDFSGAWEKDASGHWHVCANEGCAKTDTKADHTSDGAATEEKAEKCTVCEYVITPELDHKHEYNVPNKDATDHWIECRCGDKKDVTPHSAIDDNDCTTADICSCGYTVRDAKDHTPGKDDGNCKTEIKCTVCGKTAVAGTTDHNDANHDFVCDNPGCQVTVNGAPKDENEGIDLPLVPNN